MKIALLIGVIALLSLTAHPQAKVVWGNEFKMSKESGDLNVVFADNSGIYFQETHTISKMNMWGNTVRTSCMLIKLNPGLTELFRKDYDKELKDKNMETYFFIADKLYLFAKEMDHKQKKLTLFAAALDKGSGKMLGDWQLVSEWDMAEKNSEVKFRITPNSDSSQIVITSTYIGKTENRYEIKLMDAGLHTIDKPFSITNEFDPKLFQVEDFLYTRAGNPVLIGRVYGYEEGKKKKDKNLLFSNYNMRIYDNQGRLKKELNTDIGGKFLVNGKLMQTKNELVLAAFYSNAKAKKEVNGMLVQRIDPANGIIISSNMKELTGAQLTDVEADDGKKSGKKDKDDPEDGLPANMVFRNAYVAPDKGLVILAEEFKTQIFTSTGQVGGGPGQGTTVYMSSEDERFTCGNLYMGKISAVGNIEWLNVLPKNQVEEISLASGMGFSIAVYSLPGFFDGPPSRPHYAGFGCVPGNSIVNIFFNDEEQNADVLRPGGKIKKVDGIYSKTGCFQLTLDMLSGKYSRKLLFSNKGIPTAMPRLGVVMNNNMYLTGINDVRFGTKEKVVIGKITTDL